MFGVPAIIMLGVQLMAQPFFAGGVINGLGHRVGYRSFELPTAATNIVPWGLLIGGEELHNNHHAFPSSPRFAVQSWEIDMGWLFICLFRALGLARVGSLVPRPNIVRERPPSIDADTVRALFTNRLHVLRDYRRCVIRPVFRELTKQERPAVLALRSPLLLVRHPQLLDERSRQQVRELLERYAVLRTVIEFRDRLQQIWDETSAQAARSSSILALRNFALRLRTYAPAAGSE